MNCYSLPLFIVTAIVTSVASATARAEKSHALRHSEETAVSDGVHLPVPSSMMQEEMMVGSMGSAMQSEAQEVMDAKSPKAKLQRKLVSLIWLERVLQQNLASIDEKAFADKIAKSKTGLEKDTTPATAEMLSNMRTEMYEFSAPFFQKAVRDELEDIRDRQQKLLNKITAIDEGEDVDEDEDDDEDDDEEAGKKNEKKEEKKEKKKKKSAADKAADAAAKAELKRAKNARSNLFVGLMALICGSLILIVVGVAIKVNLHVRSRGEPAQQTAIPARA